MVPLYPLIWLSNVVSQPPRVPWSNLMGVWTRSVYPSGFWIAKALTRKLRGYDAHGQNLQPRSADQGDGKYQRNGLCFRGHVVHETSALGWTKMGPEVVAIHGNRERERERRKEERGMRETRERGQKKWRGRERGERKQKSERQRKGVIFNNDRVSIKVRTSLYRIPTPPENTDYWEINRSRS